MNLAYQISKCAFWILLRFEVKSTIIYRCIQYFCIHCVSVLLKSIHTCTVICPVRIASIPVLTSTRILLTDEEKLNHQSDNVRYAIDESEKFLCYRVSSTIPKDHCYSNVNYMSLERHFLTLIGENDYYLFALGQPPLFIHSISSLFVRLLFANSVSQCGNDAK